MLAKTPQPDQTPQEISGPNEDPTAKSSTTDQTAPSSSPSANDQHPKPKNNSKTGTLDTDIEHV